MKSSITNEKKAAATRLYSTPMLHRKQQQQKLSFTAMEITNKPTLLTTHDAKCKTEESHVAKVEGGLKESIHSVNFGTLHYSVQLLYSLTQLN